MTHTLVILSLAFMKEKLGRSEQEQTQERSILRAGWDHRDLPVSSTYYRLVLCALEDEDICPKASQNKHPTLLIPLQQKDTPFQFPSFLEVSQQNQTDARGR